jgi:phage-related baseplate assembly protein
VADPFDFVEVDSAKLYTSIIGSLMDSCDEALYPGDERRIFGEGIVALFVSLFSLFNDKAKQRTLRYARGNVLDAIGERYNVLRSSPTSAVAMFRFSVAQVQSENIIIPAGTRITADGGVYFATSETAVLPAMSTSIDILAECTTGGADYNGYAPGTIATLVDLIPYIGTVSNITATSGGDDGEPYTEDGDEKYRERIRLSPAIQSTAGPESAYRYFVLSADPNIIDVAIDCPEDEPNVVNLYPLMAGGELPGADVLQKVLDALSDDVRPMTDKVNAISPTAVEYQVELKYYCTKDAESSTIEAIEGVGGAIDQYNAWQTAALARNINPDQLRRFVLAPNTGTGALRVDIVKPAFKELSKAQVARLSGTPMVSHEVVSG